MTEIERVARAIANRASTRRGPTTHSALVPWALIDELRAAIWDQDKTSGAAVQRMKGAS